MKKFLAISTMVAMLYAPAQVQAQGKESKPKFAELLSFLNMNKQTIGDDFERFRGIIIRDPIDEPGNRYEYSVFFEWMNTDEQDWHYITSSPSTIAAMPRCGLPGEKWEPSGVYYVKVWCDISPNKAVYDLYRAVGGQPYQYTNYSVERTCTGQVPGNFQPPLCHHP